MVYQRKQRSEDQQIPIPQVQNSLFASPDLETDESANSYTGAAASDGLSAEAKLKHAEQHGHNFADISIFPKEGAVQRKRSIHPLRAKFFPNPDVVRQELSLPMVQAKLTVGAAGDKYEQEADRVAANVVDMIHRPVAESPVQRSLEEDGMPPQMWPQMRIQRYNQNDHVQTKLTPNQIGTEGGAASEEVTSEIERAKGGGQKLDQGLQRSMGKAMGTDFSGVRIHTDATSDRINQTIQAKAFTTGSDVFFRQGQYNPGTKSGQQLIAHELTHVVQQGQAIQRTLAPEEEAQIKNIKVSDEEELQKKPDNPTISTSSSQASTLSGVIQRDGRSKYKADAEDKGGGDITVVTRSSKGIFGSADLTDEQVKKIQKSVKAARELAANALTKVKALRTAYSNQNMEWSMFSSIDENAELFANNFVGIKDKGGFNEHDEKELDAWMRTVETALSRTQQGLAANLKLVESKASMNTEKIGGYVAPAAQEIDENTKYKTVTSTKGKDLEKETYEVAEYNPDKALKKATTELLMEKKSSKEKDLKKYKIVDIPFLSKVVRPNSIHMNFVHFVFKLDALNGGRIILHEATHKFVHTNDHQYGDSIAGGLLDPKQGVENADSYAWYAYRLKKDGV